MAANAYKNLIKSLDGLPEKKKKELVKQIMSMIREHDGNANNRCSSMVKEHTFKTQIPDCPRCKAKADLGNIVRKGYKGGVQRYYCKACGRFFMPTTNTVFAYTHKYADVWEKFIEMTLGGKSLASCAGECKIAIQTAFTWRHKILNSLKLHLNDICLSGNVEMDETLFPISFKGNHIPGGIGANRTLQYFGSNNLPRPSFKRGSDNKSSAAKNKACVVCMTKNGNEGFYAAVPGVGFMKPEMLRKTVCKHVDKENSLMIVDQYKITKNFLEENEYKYVSLLSNVSNNPNDHKPEVREGLHLQHVNALHHHLRLFLAKYSGVSTKYLENYVALYIWLKNVSAIKQKRRTKKVTITQISHAGCGLTHKQLKGLPAVPFCA